MAEVMMKQWQPFNHAWSSPSTSIQVSMHMQKLKTVLTENHAVYRKVTNAYSLSTTPNLLNLSLVQTKINHQTTRFRVPDTGHRIVVPTTSPVRHFTANCSENRKQGSWCENWKTYLRSCTNASTVRKQPPCWLLSIYFSGNNTCNQLQCVLPECAFIRLWAWISLAELTTIKPI